MISVTKLIGNAIIIKIRGIGIKNNSHPNKTINKIFPSNKASGSCA
jgi:hypothetical protein